MHRTNIIGALLLIAVFVAAYIGTYEFPSEVAIYPELICIMGIVLGVVIIFREYTGRKKSKNALGSVASRPYASFIATATLLGSLAYIFSLEYLGYAVSTALFIIIFSYLFDSSSKKYLYPIVGITVTTVIYLLFSTALHIPLPQGILF